jgi:hypothetical protein
MHAAQAEDLRQTCCEITLSNCSNTGRHLVSSIGTCAKQGTKATRCTHSLKQLDGECAVRCVKLTCHLRQVTFVYPSL